MKGDGSPKISVAVSLFPNLYALALNFNSSLLDTLTFPANNLLSLKAIVFALSKGMPKDLYSVSEILSLVSDPVCVTFTSPEEGISKLSNLYISGVAASAP